MKLNFNPTPEQCQQVANACMGTPEKSKLFNADQPYPAPSVASLAQIMQQKLLTATAYTAEGSRAAGFIFCGNFFPPHADKIPHLASGLG